MTMQSRRDLFQAHRLMTQRASLALLRGEPDVPDQPLRRLNVAAQGKHMRDGHAAPCRVPRHGATADCLPAKCEPPNRPNANRKPAHCQCAGHESAQGNQADGPTSHSHWRNRNSTAGE